MYTKHMVDNMIREKTSDNYHFRGLLYTFMSTSLKFEMLIFRKKASGP